MFNAPMTAEDVARRNLIFLRAKNSDSEDEDDRKAAAPPPELLPEDIAFLEKLTPNDFKREDTFTRLTSLLHFKLELITTRHDAQIALEKALKSFIKAYWRCIMSDQRLANPVNDVFKAILYYSDRKDMAWVGTLSKQLDFPQRMRLVGYELDAISEQHQIEIEVRRAEEKRVKQRKKEDERRARNMPEVRQTTIATPGPVAIPEVDFDSVFGPDVALSGEGFSFGERS